MAGAAGILFGAGIVFFVLEGRLDRIENIQRDMAVKRVNLQADPTPPRNYFQPVVEFEKAANRSVDAVVFINTRIGGDDFSEDFFHGYARGSGSGVIISEDGYIVTNNHVIEDASDIRVTLNDLTEYPAEIVATDPNTDLAVLKIPAEDLKPIRFADSDQVPVGRWVLAVGNPFNLTSTVTAGIVSAKARNIGILRQQMRGGMGVDYSIESFIQTDAAVNPGNSGGALVNLDGELIGINTAIATETGSYQGYSFAIPSNLVKKVISDLIQYGVVQRAFIGVSIRDITYNLYEEQGLHTRQGAYVADLTPEGAAKRAGIQPGDVITAVNGKKVESSSELQEQVANYSPGDQVQVTVWRGEQKLQFNVTLRNIKGTTSLLEPKVARSTNLSRLGVRLNEAPEAVLEDRNAEFGLLVQRLEEDGLFEKVGMKEGFLITKVDKKPVKTLEDFRRAVRQADELIYVEGVKPNGRRDYYIVNFD